MKTKYFIVVLFCVSFFVSAQTVTVVDSESDKPVEYVVIKSADNIAITNSAGKADLSKFNKKNILTFEHMSYTDFSTTFAKLKEQNLVVKLSASIVKMNEVVVSANRWEQTVKEVPNKVQLVKAKDAEFFNPQTAADLIGLSNQVFIQKSQMGGGSPMIRGFATNRILIVVDGVRMNNAIYREGNLQNVISLDANSLENTEVIFGPGSVIYGSDAVGGVMSFHTLNPRLSSANKWEVSGNALTRYSSANNEKTGHLDFTFRNRKWGFVTSLTYSDFDDLKMGSNENDEYVRPEYVEIKDGKDNIVQNSDKNVQKFSGYDQFNFMQKVRFKPNTKWDINYGFHYSRLTDVPRYDRLIQYKSGKLKYAEWYYGPQKWMMNNLSIRHSDKNSLYDDLKIILAHQDYEESRHDRKFGKSAIRERTENVNILSANIDVYKKYDETSTLYYGLEAVYNKVNSDGHQRNIFTGEKEDYASRYPDGSKYYSYALYLNYKNKLNSKMTFISGIRYSQVVLESKFDKQFYDFPFNEIEINTGTFNYSLGIAYKPAHDLQINVNASTGFRAPNIDDIGKVFDSEPGSVVVPNPDLSSEYAHNIEATIIKHFNNRLKIEATGFYTILKDAMVRRDFTFNGKDSIMYDGTMSKVQALVNADKATVYGLQLGIDAQLLKGLSLRSILNYTKGEDQDDVPLRHVAPLFGSTHLIYQVKNLKADLYAVYNGEISYEDLAPSEQSKTHMYATDGNGNPYSPSWVTFNLKTSYLVSKNLQLTGGIENIFDKRYRPYSSGIVAPGRNFVFSLKASM
ncbi:MAG: TonB-dependent receptor domain-containing protein [Rhodothermaceae bacterium]